MNEGKVRCDQCGKIIQTYVPAGGDGSGVVKRFHNKASGERCEGAKEEATADELDYSAPWQP